MTSHVSCSACVWVSHQLGSSTPCPWHAGQLSAPPATDDGPAAASAAVRPTADRPSPFTDREYARLLLLRSRLQARQPPMSPTHPTGAFGGWTCAPWLRPYLELVTGLRSEAIEALLNDRTADAETEPDRAWRIDRVRAQVRVLEALHARGLLRTLPDDGRSD